MNVNMNALAIASGVVVQSSSIKGWMTPVSLAVVVILGAIALVASGFNHNAVAISLTVILVASAIAFFVVTSHYDSSTEVANETAIETHYGIRNLKPTDKDTGSHWAIPGRAGNRVPVSFSDSTGAAVGSLIVDGDRITLCVSGDGIHQTEYGRPSKSNTGSYGYSNAKVSGVPATDMTTGGNR